MLTFLIIASILGVILSRPPIARALLGLLKDHKELALFAVFLLVEVALVAVVLAVVGPRFAFYLILASVVLFVIWAMRPPAQRR